MIFPLREKTPPYALDYTNSINNINYETINNLKNKEIIINNENAHLLAEKSALEKNLKKHSMFINALSWKKFNANKKKSGDGTGKSKGLAFRAPLDNIHPLVDNNKNIQNALCHGTKSTSLTESSRNLDIARNAVSVGSGSNSAIQAQASLHTTSITAASQQQQQQQKTQHNSASSNGNGLLPTNTSNTTRDVQTTKQQCNNNLSNKNFQLTQDKTHYHIRKETNDNEDPLKKLANNNNNNIKTEQLVKPAPKKTVIQVKLLFSSFFV